jgi:CIC family chloride channel protein
MVSRWLGSLVNVGSGGSAGLEGPIVYSAAAIGSAIGGLFHLDERRRAVLLACGVAGGISGVFDAPMTGMIFSMEVVLAEWSAFSIVPVVVAAVAGTELARYLSEQWLGLEEPFVHAAFSMQTWDLVACIALGVLAGGFSTALTRAIALGERLALHLPSRRLLAPVAFGVSVGLIGWLLPQTIGEGYGTVSLALQNSLPAGALLCLALLLGKLVTTALTLGSGAPGGVFAPSLVVGSLLGVTFSRALHAIAPATLHLSSEGSYAIVGMAGMVAGVMQAPLTGILLVMEVTSGYEVILPLMIVSVISLIVARRFERYSLYTREVAETGELLRPGTDRRILADLRLIEILDEDVTPVAEDLSLADFVRVAKHSHRNHFPVLRSGTEEYVGMLELTFVREILLDPELARVTLVGTMMDTEVPTLRGDATLASALEVFERESAWVLPVVENGTFVGLASKAKIFDHYRRELTVQTQG